MANGTIQKQLPRWGEVLRNLTFPYTAPSDGIAIVDVARNTNGACYMYITDSTAGFMVSKDTTATNDFTLTFPMVSGHKYTISAQSNVSGYALKLYPLT